MTDAMFEPPMHPRKQLKRFGDMRKNDHHQTSRTEQLQERAHSLSPKEQDYRTRKQRARWHQCDYRLNECDIHGVTLVRFYPLRRPLSEWCRFVKCTISPFPLDPGPDSRVYPSIHGR